MTMEEAWKEYIKMCGHYSLVGEYQLAIAKEFFELGWKNAVSNARKEALQKEVED